MTTTCEHLNAARKKTASLRAHLLLIAEGAIVAPGMTDPQTIATHLLGHVDRIDADLSGVAAGHAVLAGNVRREAEAFGRELGFTPAAADDRFQGVAVAVMPFGMGDAPAPANGKASRIPGRFESAVRGERAG